MTESSRRSPGEDRRRAELLYAEFLDRVETDGDKPDFERFCAKHPDDERLLREIHAGMEIVHAAMDRRTLTSEESGYEILERLGDGAHGTVHRARDRALDCDVAIKTFRPDSGEVDPVTHFLFEARNMAKVRHPNVLDIHAVDETADGNVRLVLEYVKGRTFERIVEEDGPLSAREAAQVGLDLCSALGALHEVNLVHMDVKPGNVMREEGGRTVLLDFGLVRSPSLDDDRIGGTPPFMAPEHFGQGQPGPQTDVYGVGATLYWLVARRYPLEATRLPDLRERIIAGKITPLLDVQPKAPREFVAIVEKAMHPDLEQRYGSVGFLERALREFVAGATSDTEPAGPPSRAVVATVSVLAVSALGISALFYPDACSSTVPGDEVRGAGSVQAGEVRLDPNAPVDAERISFEAKLVLNPGAGQPVEVDERTTVQVGDGLALELTADEDVYVYLFNEDEAGHCYTLYPAEEARSLPGRVPLRLPKGTSHWEVDSEGGAEHLFLVVSRGPDPLADLIAENAPRPTKTDGTRTVRGMDRGVREKMDSLSRGFGKEVVPRAEKREYQLSQSIRELVANYKEVAQGNPDVALRSWTLAHARPVTAGKSE